MNPYPFVGLNHFTVPVGISVSNVDSVIIGSHQHDKDRDWYAKTPLAFRRLAGPY
jgi:hypothetical protein